MNAVAPQTFLSRRFERAPELLHKLRKGWFRNLITIAAYPDLA